MVIKTFIPFPTLKTDRLILRQLSMADFNEILVLRSDPYVNKYLDRQPSNSVEEVRNFIHIITESVNSNELIYWAITLKNSYKLVGTICYFNISMENSKAEIGFELLPEFQGKGIMQEATKKVIEYGHNNIGLKTIEAYTHRDNEKSIKLLEKFNFRKQSTIDINPQKRFIILKLDNISTFILNKTTE